ncbi:MAG: hypothetical protein ACI9OH_002446 [Oleispira sp.]|jgi:hypothetical protein
MQKSANKLTLITLLQKGCTLYDLSDFLIKKIIFYFLSTLGSTRKSFGIGIAGRRSGLVPCPLAY